MSDGFQTIIIACMSRKLAEYEVRSVGVDPHHRRIIYATKVAHLQGRRRAIYVDLLELRQSFMTSDRASIYEMKAVALALDMHEIHISDLKRALNSYWLIDPTVKNNSNDRPS